jgi:hypothetical protein
VPFSVNEAELNEVVTAWIAGQNADDGSPDQERNWWAIERVMDWSLLRDGESLWRFILAVYQRDIPANVAGVLASGPIEDLLAYDGSQFIDRVEELARTDPKFNWLLGGVWRNAMTDDVWQRVQSTRNQMW